MYAEKFSILYRKATAGGWQLVFAGRCTMVVMLGVSEGPLGIGHSIEDIKNMDAIGVEFATPEHLQCETGLELVIKKVLLAVRSRCLSARYFCFGQPDLVSALLVLREVLVFGGVAAEGQIVLDLDNKVRVCVDGHVIYEEHLLF